MKMTGNTILITGGAAGIGLALAERFYNAGNTVLEEIAANLEAPIHLSLLFLPLLLRRENASLINISSGLSITPAV